MKKQSGKRGDESIPVLRDLISTLKRPFTSEREEFISHLRVWIPVSTMIGIVVGFIMSLFFISISLINHWLLRLPSVLPMMIGSTIILLLIKLGFESTSSNGINYVIDQKHKHEPVPIQESREFITSSIVLGSGLPVGKEGPALIIGSAFACKIAQFLGIKDEDLHDAITIGSAAATGALFQAPLGSAVFATEVPYKQDSDEPILMVAFLASVLSAITLKSILFFMNPYIGTDLHLFAIGEASLNIDWNSTLLAFVLGIIVGIIGLIFIDIYYRYKKVLSHFSHNSQVVIGVFLMIIILLIGGVMIPDLYILDGISSFQAIESFISSASWDILLTMLFSLLIQILATTALIGSGFPGGIFGPSLAIGAIIGICFSIIFRISDLHEITAYAIIGMSASHSATTKTPVASILLILEITGLPNLVIPIVIANISSYIISGTRSLYDKQSYSREVNILRELSEYDQLEEFRVLDVMTDNQHLVSVKPDETINDLRKLIAQTEKNTIPVVENKICIGIITPQDIEFAPVSNKVQEHMTRDPIVLHPSMTAQEAMYTFLDKDVERCPVLDSNEKICGIISMKDILMGHRRLTERKRQYFN